MVDGLSSSGDSRTNRAWSSDQLIHHNLPWKQPLHKLLLNIEIFPQHQLGLSFLPSGLVASFLLPCPTLSAAVIWAITETCVSIVNTLSAVNQRYWCCLVTPQSSRVFCFTCIQRTVCVCLCLHHSGSFPAQVSLQKTSPFPLFSGFSLTFILRVFNTLQSDSLLYVT